jgi:Na+-driven multidrug efflux pump
MIERGETEAVEDVGVEERRVLWAPWSPAQIVALIIGVFYLILGAIALAASGGNANGFAANPHVTALGFHQTPVLGIIEIVFGLFMVMAGAIPGAGRGTMAFLGTLALAFGIVVLAAYASMYDALGTDAADGWLYVITGIVALVAGMIAPIFLARSRESTGMVGTDYRDGRSLRRRWL